ncbi:MAG: DUF4234 domain-containing protein [Colwellia sp.]
MSDLENTTEVENSFEAPQANLTEGNFEKPILEMKRFSAWGVFFLTVITFGIYYIYWFISRGNKINTLATGSKVKLGMLYAYIVLSIGSVVFSTAVSSGPSAADALVIAMVSMLLSIVSVVLLLMAVFSFRRVIEEVASVGSQTPVRLSGVLTFFFAAVYFPYKINEAIDNQSE